MRIREFDSLQNRHFKPQDRFYGGWDWTSVLWFSKASLESSIQVPYNAICHGLWCICLVRTTWWIPWCITEHKQPPYFFSLVQLWNTLDTRSPTESWRVKLRKVSHHMSRFLVCSSALLGQPGSPGATGDLRDCITGVATLLDDSHGIRWPQWTVLRKTNLWFLVAMQPWREWMRCEKSKRM